MHTPICDFVNEYAQSGTLRLHVPGHKGTGAIGCERLDITEVSGADELYDSSGIIAQSEQNASDIFASRQTFYSAGGSSQCIKAMLYLALTAAKNNSKTVIATRNAHVSFLQGCALLGINCAWAGSNNTAELCSCSISASDVSMAIKSCEEAPLCVYITSPDYIGNVPDIKQIAEVCKAHDVPLVVDGAHGAYMRFLQDDYYKHPLELGADMCCDSAHKTLPVLTGGAYLHVSKTACANFEQSAKKALLMFGSTSPSYLILQSLDMCNKLIADGYDKKTAHCAQLVGELKKELINTGVNLFKSDPLRITADAKSLGFSAKELAALVRKSKIEPEYIGESCVVMMISANNSGEEIKEILRFFKNIAALNKPPLPQAERKKINFERVMSMRSAALSPCVTVATLDAVGKICASHVVPCPPGVPVIMGGERITADVADFLQDLGVFKIDVVK